MIEDWLSAAARAAPDAPFVTAGGQVWTYADVEDLVARRAGGAAFAPGDVVAVLADNTLESIVTVLALWRVGAACQLVNTRLTRAEVEAQLGASGAVGVAEGGGSGAPRPGTEHDPADAALVVFTSGSQGAPRGVVLTWGNLAAAVSASADHLRHTSDDRWLCVLPLFHVGGMSIVLRSLWCRSELVLHERFQADAVAATLREVTLGSLVAASLRTVLEADPGPYDGLRALLVGGGSTPQPLVDRAVRAGLPVLSTYGMTEAGSQIATAAEVGARQVMPIPGAEVDIAPDGEILVRGPMVAERWIDGHRRAPDEWLATGDVGEWLGDGAFRVLGRKDDLIITGGENVMPDEVEAVLRSVPGVRDVLVLGVDDPAWGQRVAALLVGDAEPAAVAQAARSGLAGFKIPTRWLTVDDLPRTSIGKPSRRLAAALFEERL